MISFNDAAYREYRDYPAAREFYRRDNPSLAAEFDSMLETEPALPASAKIEEPTTTAKVVANQDCFEYVYRILACRHITPSERLVGIALAMRSNGNTTYVYCGAESLAVTVGTFKGEALERRQRLLETGWLSDTGKCRGRTALYELTRPARCPCGCEARGFHNRRKGRESADR